MIKIFFSAAALLFSFHVQAAAIFYTNEAVFNTDTSGLTLSLEGFETPFATAPAVDFGVFSINANNVSDLESLEGNDVDTSHPATEGVRLLQYVTLTPTAGGGFTGFGILSSLREKFNPPPAPQPTEAELRDEQNRRDAETIRQERLKREEKAKELRRKRGYTSVSR